MATLFSIGCMRLEGGKRLCVDSHYGYGPKRDIRAEFDKWNAVGQEYLGFDLIIDDGDCDDADGFHFDDFSDDRNMLYYGVNGPEFREIKELLGNDTVHRGYGTRTDVVIFAFLMYTEEDSADGVYYDEARYDSGFSGIVLHELGHYLGLAHLVGYDDAVMSADTSDNHYEITPTDIRALCEWYDCIKSPPVD